MPVEAAAESAVFRARILAEDSNRFGQSARMKNRKPAVGSHGSRRIVVFMVLLASAGVLLVLNAGMGAVAIPPGTVASLLAEPLGLQIGNNPQPIHESVFWSIRLPRIVHGMLAASALAAAGVGLQAAFRNPLAESQVVGASWGAALGAASAIAITGKAGHFVPAFAAALSALLATLLAYRIARRGPRVEVVTLILAGVAINAIAAATVGLVVNVSNSGLVRSFSFWSLGTLGGATWRTVVSTALLVLPGIAFLAFRSRRLDVLLLGDDEARHSGIAVKRLRVEVMTATALVTGAVVSATGVIGFIGLLAPHAVRIAVGPYNRILLPGAALAGMVILLAVDLIARTVAAPSEVPLGVITSLVGGPFFLWLLYQTRRAQGGWG